MPAFDDTVSRASQVSGGVRTVGIPARPLWVGLVTLFIAGDVLFIALHLLFELKVTKDPVFSLDGDRIAGEFWQYLKEYWIVLAMAVLLWRRRHVLYAAWSLTFAYLLVDDAVQIHERAGPALGSALNLPVIGSLAPRHSGQIIFAAICGMVLLAAMALFYRKADEDARRITRWLFGGLCLMGLFGVVCDAIHAMTALKAMAILEEGGELIIMSGICALMVCEVLSDGTAHGNRQDRAGTSPLIVPPLNATREGFPATRSADVR